MSALDALSRALAAKDGATWLHSRRTAAFADVLAATLGIDPRLREQLEVAALLHDVGKIAVPDVLLAKPEPLSVDEWVVVQRHSEVGADIVCSAGLEEAAEWILHLHERFDGAGYPAGLAGADIPFESRLLHAADVLEALTGPRAYREALPLPEGADALDQCAGTQLDPAFAFPLARLAREEGDRLEDAAATGGVTFRSSDALCV